MPLPPPFLTARLPHVHHGQNLSRGQLQGTLVVPQNIEQSKGKAGNGYERQHTHDQPMEFVSIAFI